jgi:hypothetical protein
MNRRKLLGAVFLFVFFNFEHQWQGNVRRPSPYGYLEKKLMGYMEETCIARADV